MRVCSLGWENPLEEEMATHSNVLDWKIPWTEEPGGLQSMELQRVIDTTEHEHLSQFNSVLSRLGSYFFMEHQLTYFSTLVYNKCLFGKSWYFETSEKTETQGDYPVCLWSPNWLDT